MAVILIIMVMDFFYELGNNLSADIYLNDDAGFHIPPNIYNITDQTVVEMTDADGVVSTQTFLLVIMLYYLNFKILQIWHYTQSK